MPDQLLINEYRTELQKGYIPEAITLLLDGLSTLENAEEWIKELTALLSDYETFSSFKQGDMEQIRTVKEKHTGKNYSDLTVFEATWSQNYEDPQMAFEILSEALIKDPEHNGLLTTIEELNSCSGDAPVFADEMETIAKVVHKGEFPRETFEYLLLALADPEYPDQFDLAIKIANGR